MGSLVFHDFDTVMNSFNVLAHAYPCDVYGFSRRRFTVYSTAVNYLLTGAAVKVMAILDISVFLYVCWFYKILFVELSRRLHL